MRPVVPTRLARSAGAMLTLVVAASLLSGCVHPTPRAPAGDPIVAARALSDAPDAVRAGDAGKSCGAFVLDQGATVPADAIDCLAAAASAGRAAELAWSTPTTEGDPIVSFAVVEGGDGEVTVYSTNAFDSYGGDPRWMTSTCTDAASATSPAGCPVP